ncbi:chromate transporter [Methylobrevis pamukkalensis]|uniref:Chromate transport protein n=1 Tax=Methylobrevis pamukkalensis TaxID=1439726 RepID=A0A1E3GY99_9HYPH|nr:chromate transporter [Methylobrevis pamukkalensis]ODN68536.1 Chromate transport protein [Methylobrevis pamukkalensis]
MSRIPAAPATPATSDPATPATSDPVRRVGFGALFLAFFGVGATAFGGGVVAYLRHALVTRRGWIGDDGFMSALEVAQALPGLNATNLAVIVGDRLRGPRGAMVALLGIVLPGAVAVIGLAALYAAHAADPRVNAVLIASARRRSGCWRPPWSRSAGGRCGALPTAPSPLPRWLRSAGSSCRCRWCSSPLVRWR